MTLQRMTPLEWRACGMPTEPAMGTLDERLEIISRRLGGNAHRRPTASQAERIEYTRWLAANDPAACNPYIKRRAS